MTDSALQTHGSTLAPPADRGKIIFAMTGAAAAAGGIASSNLNVLVALEELSKITGRPLIVLSLHESDEEKPNFLAASTKFSGFGGGKRAFSARLVSLYRGDAFYLFDHVRLALPIALMALLGFRNFVILAHGSESWRRIRLTSKWLFRKARLCLTNSRYTLSQMQRTFSGFEGKACVLGLSPLHGKDMCSTPSSGIDIELEAVDGKTRPLGAHVILLVGRMDRNEREKGHYELLEIWPSVLSEFPDAQLVFTGPGNDRVNLTAMASRLQIESNVFFPGYIDTRSLGELYAHCRAFVMPSRQEGFGLVYLEAMMWGKPCVGCRNGGGEEVIEDGVSGFLLDNPFELGELQEAVCRLLADPQLAAQLGRSGSRRLREQFTSAHAQNRLKQYLMPLLRCN